MTIHPTLPIEISTRTQQLELVQGLITWLELGLITDGHLSLQIEAHETIQHSMSLTISSDIMSVDLVKGLQLWSTHGLLSHSRIDLTLSLTTDHPALLTGLDRWLTLNLLTDAQVSRLARDYLTCVVLIPPPLVVEAVKPPEPLSLAVPSRQAPPPTTPVWPGLTLAAPSSDRPPTPEQVPEPVPVSRTVAAVTRPPKPQVLTWAQQLLQSLLAELSVIWLLLLGVFMVIVSSGVLIANQWGKFPIAGQYGVLWLYTLAFGASSLWSARKSNLRLTAKALRMVTLLLVPLNFVALDVFALWQPLYNLPVFLFAALTLTLLARTCCQQLGSSGGLTITYLLLSYLQWGWARPAIPLEAVYVGVISTTVLTLRQRTAPTAAAPAGEASTVIRAFAIPFKTLLLVYGIALLLGRAIFVAGVDLSQLGLALGLSGWLLVWRGVPPPAPFGESSQLTRLTLWGSVGGGLVFLGWLLAFESVPWQAIGVSILALLIFSRRLLRTWRRFELVALLLIGLQIFWLAWQQLPPPGQQAATDLYARLVGPNVHPVTALSLSFIPYMIGMVLLSDWLADYRKQDLARFCGWLTLGFGIVLTGLSLVNPALRTLNLAASTLVLGWVVQRQWRHYVNQDRSWQIPFLPVQQLAHLTHIGGVSTLIAATTWAWPQLRLTAWATLMLVLTLAEWSFSFGPAVDPDVPTLEHGRRRLLRRSAWPLGLGLSACAYLLFIANQLTIYDDVAEPKPVPDWGILWLAVPLALTGIARSLVSRRQLASQLSLVGLGLLQMLTLAQPGPRLVSLGAATGLMVMNTRFLAQSHDPKWTRLGSWLMVGFGLGFWLASAGAGLQWRLESLWSLGALTLLGLWMLRHGFQCQTTPLAKFYAWACDFWAVGLAGLLLLGLDLIGSDIAWPSLRIGLNIRHDYGLSTLVLPALILMATVVYRSWQSPRSARITWLSVVGLMMALLPTLAHPIWRLLSLSLALGLMLLQTNALKHITAAVITVGLGLGLGAAVLMQGWPRIGAADWLLVGAIVTGLLWILRHTLLLRTRQLSTLYAQAADGWAIALCSTGLAVFISDALRAPFLAGSPIRPNPQLSLITLMVIMGSTAYRSWQRPRNPTSLWLSLSTALVAQIPLLEFASIRLAGLSMATGVGLGHTRFLKKLLAAGVTIGLGLACIGFGLWDGALGQTLRIPEVWLLVGASLLSGLWILRYILSRDDSPLLMQYARAADLWAIGLCNLTLIGLTAHSLLISWDKTPAPVITILAIAMTVGAMLFRGWEQPNNWTIYGLGWGLELLTIELLSRFDQSLIALSVANIGLGILAQILGDWRHRRTGPEMLNSWHIIPLFYGALGTVLRSGFFNSWTGFSTLGLVVIAVGVGRRQPAFKPLIYLAMIGISATAYELLFYQIQSLSLGDQLLGMAALATSIVYAYRILSPWLARYFQIGAAELTTVAHLHWALGSILLLLAIVYPIAYNQMVGLGAGLFLTRYAIQQGRHQPNPVVAELWTYTGLVEALGLTLYAAHNFLPTWSNQVGWPWVGALAAIVALPLYQISWESWGWPPRPWHVAAIILPLAAVGSSLRISHGVSLLAVAGFYELLARQQPQPRWRYLSLLLVDGAIWKGLQAMQWLTPFAFVCLLGGSILVISWLDLTLDSSSSRRLRHTCRLLGAGIILTAALMLYPERWLLSGSLSLIALFAGLALQIRAFLYTGTLIFIITAVYHLVILSFQYPLLKWIIGLIVGLAFIVIAASFETRRNQLSTLLRYWSTAMQQWK